MKKNDLQKLKEELDRLLEVMPVNSPEVIDLSRRIDSLIVGHYKKQKLV